MNWRITLEDGVLVGREGEGEDEFVLRSDSPEGLIKQIAAVMNRTRPDGLMLLGLQIERVWSARTDGEGITLDSTLADAVGITLDSTLADAVGSLLRDSGGFATLAMWDFTDTKPPIRIAIAVGSQPCSDLDTFVRTTFKQREA